MKNAVNERIKLFIKHNFKSTREFALQANIAPSTIQAMFDRDTKPSFDVIESIINAFANLNIEWLLTGQGEMLKSNQQIENTNNNTIISTNVNGKENAITNSTAYLDKDTQISKLKDKIIIQGERIVTQADKIIELMEINVNLQIEIATLKKGKM